MIVGLCAKPFEVQGVSLDLAASVMRHCCCQNWSCGNLAAGCRWAASSQIYAAASRTRCQMLMIFQRRGRPQLQRIFNVTREWWRVESSSRAFWEAAPSGFVAGYQLQHGECKRKIGWIMAAPMANQP